MLGIRARSFFFFAASNPTIRNGGFLNESKKEIEPLIPKHVHPKTVFFTIPSNGDIVLLELRNKGLSFPLIGKPDIGGRGRGVKALKDEEDVRSYVSNAFVDFHIQEYVAYKKEVGIFYHRSPGAEAGKITGIVRKEFLTVTGDGIHTLKELLEKNKRALIYLKSMEIIHRNSYTRVLEAGEKMIVSPYGNHARGAMFIDDTELVDEVLTKTIDDLCKEIPGFFYGRLDIRFDNWEDLKKGKKFSIIEVNGAGSEATHIYDPRHSLFYAWKEIIRHWIILYRVSRMNHERGHRYLTFKEGIQMFREDKAISRKLAAMPE
jgi:hypothetical protein